MLCTKGHAHVSTEQYDLNVIFGPRDTTLHETGLGPSFRRQNFTALCETHGHFFPKETYLQFYIVCIEQCSVVDM